MSHLPFIVDKEKGEERRWTKEKREEREATNNTTTTNHATNNKTTTGSNKRQERRRERQDQSRELANGRKDGLHEEFGMKRHAGWRTKSAAPRVEDTVKVYKSIAVET